MPEHARTRNEDLFSLKKLNSLGPSDYDPNKITKNSPKVVIKQSVVDLSQGGSVKKQMESYLGKIFDHEGKTREKGAATEQPSSKGAADAK